MLGTNDNDIRDYFEGHTLLPVTRADVRPGSSTSRSAVPLSSLHQPNKVPCLVENPLSCDVVSKSSENEATMDTISQSTTSNELSKQGKVNTLGKIFPNLAQEQLE